MIRGTSVTRRRHPGGFRLVFRFVCDFGDAAVLDNVARICAFLSTAVIFCAARVAWAHPGHGESASSSVAHVFEPQHAGWLVAVIALWIFGRHLRAKRARGNGARETDRASRK